jgi:fatty-acid desaturase
VAKSLPPTSIAHSSLLRKEDKYGPFTKHQDGFVYAFRRTANTPQALLTFGGGWHNNHHAAPQYAGHGLAWYEFDLNWYGICALRWLRLAWDIKLPREFG